MNIEISDLADEQVFAVFQDRNQTRTYFVISDDFLNDVENTNNPIGVNAVLGAIYRQFTAKVDGYLQFSPGNHKKLEIGDFLQRLNNTLIEEIINSNDD